jgi:sterol 14-demethylase
MATCRELAEDKQAVRDLTQKYLNIEQNNTPVPPAPLVPRSSEKGEGKGDLDLNLLICNNEKIQSIDLFIANGDSNEVITGVSAPYLFYHFCAHFNKHIYKP